MIRVSVMYPYREGARFDVQYSANQHMDMARAAMKEHGLLDIRVDKGFVGTKSKSPPVYVCIATLTFETMAGYKEGFRIHGPHLVEDLPNFTDIEPVVQVNEAIL